MFKSITAVAVMFCITAIAVLTHLDDEINYRYSSKCSKEC